MKKLFAFVLLASSVAAWSDVTTPPRNLRVASTASVAASGTTTTSANSLGIPYTNKFRDDVTFELSFKSGATNVFNQVFLFQRSIDGLTWATTPTTAVVVPANGTSTVVCTTNLSLQGHAAIRLYQIVNTNANAASFITNITVRVVEKTLQ